MPEKYQFKAPAKINLFLEVDKLRDDGYHDITTVFQAISLVDLLSFQLATKGITLYIANSALPADRTNLAYQAAELMQTHSQTTQGISIHLEKNIPIGGGLAGGSTDAASVLVACNQLWKTSYTIEELEDLGSLLGMDVPFCIRGGTVLAKGRGELVIERYITPTLHFILVNPDISVSTKKIYQTIDSLPYSSRHSPSAMISAIQSNNIEIIAHSLFNRLEDATFSLYPQIRQIKVELIELGCLNSLMSGSGSSVLGLCRNQEEAQLLSREYSKNSGYLASAVSSLPASEPGMFYNI